MQELMKSDPTASLPNDSLFQGNNRMGLGTHDVDRINFIRMLLAIKMVKTDGEASPVAGTDNKLFLGSIGAAYNKKTLTKNKITHILCLCEGVREKFEKDIKYLTCPTQDISNYDIALKFIPCSDFIDDSIKKGGRVLVHCFQGKSRCTAITMSYLMLRKGLGFNDAIEACRKSRPVVAPNLGFVAQLRALDRSLVRNRVATKKKREEKRENSKKPSPTKPSPIKGPNASAGPLSLSDLKDVRTEGTDKSKKAAAKPKPKAALPKPPPPTSSRRMPPPPPVDAHPDHEHVSAAASVMPNFSQHGMGLRERFLSSSKLTLSFDNSGSIVVQPKKEPISQEELERIKKEQARIKAENERIAIAAAARLYSSAIKQKEKADFKKEILPAEFTFKPEINEMSQQHAMVARARGRNEHGYMAETDAYLSLKEARLKKAEMMESRAERMDRRMSSTRFNGFGSIFYDTEEGSPRDLGRTSPTEEDWDFTPLINKSTEETRERTRDPNRISKPTASSIIGEKIAKRKKEFIEEKGGRGVRDRMSMLGNLDEAEALYISEARQARMKKDEIKSNMVAATYSGSSRGPNESVSPPRQRIRNILKASGSPEAAESLDMEEMGEKIMKDTLSSFLRRENAKGRREDIKHAREDKITGYLNDRFRSPGGMLYEIEHSANIDVAHWQHADSEEMAATYKKVITDKEEQESNERRIKQMYENGLKHYNEREVLRRNAPLEKECTFSPTFFTKGGGGKSDEGIAFGKGLGERGAAANRTLNTSGTSSAKTTTPKKVTPKKAGGNMAGMGSPGARVVTLRELREEGGAGEEKVKVEEKGGEPVQIKQETKKKLETLEKKDLIQVVEQLTRRDSDLATMEQYLHEKLGKNEGKEAKKELEAKSPKGSKTPNTPMFMSAPGSPASGDDFDLNADEEEELRRLEEEEEAKLAGGGGGEKGGGEGGRKGLEEMF